MTSNIESATHKESHTKFKLYPWRFAVVTAIFFVILVNVMQFGAYGSITPTVAKHYDTEDWVINNLNVWNLAAFFFSVYPGTWLLDVYGLRPAIITAAGLNAFGALLRWLSFASDSQTTKLGLLSAGSFIIGASSPLSADAVTKAAAHWFSGEGRLTANAVMSLATPIGGALGLLLGPQIVNNDPNNVDFFNMILFILSLVLGLASFLVFNNPTTPPSQSAEKGTIEFKQGLNQIFKNGGFWILVVVFTGVYASFQLISTFLSNYVTPYGFSEDDSGNFGVTVVGSGIVAAIIAGIILDRTKAHKVALKVLSVVMCLGCIGLYFGTTNSNLVLVFVSSALIGIGGLPLMSISFELGAEATYPVAEATSTGLLMTVSQVFTISMIFVTNALAESGSGKLWKGLICVIALSFVAMIGSFAYTSDNRRIEMEKSDTSNSLE